MEKDNTLKYLQELEAREKENKLQHQNAKKTSQQIKSLIQYKKEVSRGADDNIFADHLQTQKTGPKKVSREASPSGETKVGLMVAAAAARPTSSKNKPKEYIRPDTADPK